MVILNNRLEKSCMCDGGGFLWLRARIDAFYRSFPSKAEMKWSTNPTSTESPQPTPESASLKSLVVGLGGDGVDEIGEIKKEKHFHHS